jgi:hypothetical protein
MKLNLKIFLVIVLLVIFFFVPIIPSSLVYQTKAQREETRGFCNTHGCGVLFMYTPYHYAKESLYNIFIRKPSNSPALQLDTRPEVPQAN